MNYAVFGMLLLVFMRMSGKHLLMLGSLLLLLPQLFFSILLVLMTFSDPAGVAHYTNIAAVQDSVAAYASGSFTDIIQQRFSDWYTVNSPGNLLFLILSILPVMMIGAGAGKLNLLEKVGANKRRWMLLGAGLLITSVAIKMLPILIESNAAYSYIQDYLGGPFLSVSYAVILALLLENKKMKKWTKPLASAGRMSLTNYLMQSVIGTLIFYSYGFGLYGEVTLTTGTYLAIGIFVIQMLLSEIWLSKFRYGPVEKLWRVLSYGKSSVMKKGEL